MAIYTPNPEQLGRRRFPDNKAFRKQLSNLADNVLGQMQGLLASNYPSDPNTNLAVFYKVLSREAARLQLGINAINDDKQYTLTRPQFLQQVLGERLGLGSRIAPTNYDDQSYRNYLLSIKNAYLVGSLKDNIEALASEFTGQTVNIRELYLEARDPHSSLDVATSANMMVVNVLIDTLRAGTDLATLSQDLNFFVGLVRPAHVLYDTRFIWTEQIDVNKVHDILFGDTGGGCVPIYNYDYFTEPTIKALLVFELPGPVGALGSIEAIHHDDYVFYLNNSTRVIYEPGYSRAFDETGHEIPFNDLEIGKYVRITYQEIPGSFNFWYPPTGLITTWASQFYKSVFQRPLFQETVKKVMDRNGRFPLQIKTTPTTVCDRWVQDALQPYYEDLRGNCNVGRVQPAFNKFILQARMGFPRLDWPYDSSTVHDKALLGNDYISFMQYSPLTDGSSHAAGINDVSVKFDGTSLNNAVTLVDASTGRVELNQTLAFWDGTFSRYPMPGDVFDFNYHYLSDSTNFDASTSKVYGITYWQLPYAPLIKDSSGTLADTSSVDLYVDGTHIPGALISLDPLLGHAIIQSTPSFWNSTLGRIPVIGDTFEFDSTWGDRFQYPALFDDLARPMDYWIGNPYVIVLDGTGTGNIVDSSSAATHPDPVLIGYRFRTDLLHHASVLNSPDTLLLNQYQKPATRASIVNQEAVLNHSNYFFSPEFLYDQNPVTKPLGDDYLDNGLDPVLKLREGTPTFQQTFSYQPGLIYQKKLQDIRKNHRLLMYADLLQKEFRDDGESLPLSSICEDILTFKTRLGEDDYNGPYECQPWILFDTVDVSTQPVQIPGDYKGVPNLRVADKLLRQNFILREVEPSGTATVSYEVTNSDEVDPPTSFTLPSTLEIFYNDDYIDFPSLPVVDLDDNLAGIDDITCVAYLEDNPSVAVPVTITSINPTAGIVTVEYPTATTYSEIHTVTAEESAANQIRLSGFIYSDAIAVSIVRGVSQYLDDDFRISGRRLFWYFGNLQNRVLPGDELRISYTYNPFAGAKLVFTYHIQNDVSVPVIIRDWSRIMDDKYVFAGLCHDVEAVKIGLNMTEYLPGLDDDSDSITIPFFNTNTLEIEKHEFTGPVFETYEAIEDEIGAPGNFYNSLVRIKRFSGDTPLNYSSTYSFINDKLVRFRKKTFRELMPDRTFKTTKIVEMLPV
jgi:hypothetical protein